MLGKIVSGIIISSLITFPQTTVTSFANECKDTVNGNKNNKILEDANEQRLINDLNVQLFNIKDFGNKSYNINKSIKEYNLLKQKVEARLKQIEERELEEQKRLEEEKNKHKRNFIVTYYGSTYNECGNNHFITASGVPVEEGHIAVPNNIPFGSKIILNGVEYLATDTGNPKYICELDDGTLRVDVFVARQYGESDYQYEKRVNNMGTKKIEGELYLNN